MKIYNFSPMKDINVPYFICQWLWGWWVCRSGFHPNSASRGSVFLSSKISFPINGLLGLWVGGWSEVGEGVDGGQQGGAKPIWTFPHYKVSVRCLIVRWGASFFKWAGVGSPTKTSVRLKNAAIIEIVVLVLWGQLLTIVLNNNNTTKQWQYFTGQRW